MIIIDVQKEQFPEDSWLIREILISTGSSDVHLGRAGDEPQVHTAAIRGQEFPYI